MRSISRRIRRLEGTFGLGETEFSRLLKEQMEAGRRRVAAAMERGELERVEPLPSRDGADDPRTIDEILHDGRRRNRLRRLAPLSAGSEVGS